MATKADLLKKKAQSAGTKTSAAASLITAKEDSAKEIKKAVSFFVIPSNYEKIMRLASYRAAAGEKTDAGQPMSAGALINEAIAEYLTAHEEELSAWENLTAKLKH